MIKAMQATRHISITTTPERQEVELKQRRDDGQEAVIILSLYQIVEFKRWLTEAKGELEKYEVTHDSAGRRSKRAAGSDRRGNTGTHSEEANESAAS